MFLGLLINSAGVETEGEETGEEETNWGGSGGESARMSFGAKPSDPRLNWNGSFRFPDARSKGHRSRDSSWRIGSFCVPWTGDNPLPCDSGNHSTGKGFAPIGIYVRHPKAVHGVWTNRSASGRGEERTNWDWDWDCAVGVVDDVGWTTVEESSALPCFYEYFRYVFLFRRGGRFLVRAS